MKVKRGGLNLIGTFWCTRERLLAEQNPYGVDWANIETQYYSDRDLWVARVDWHSTRVDVDGYTEKEAIDNACKSFLTWADRVLHKEDTNNEHHAETYLV